MDSDSIYSLFDDTIEDNKQPSKFDIFNKRKAITSQPHAASHKFTPQESSSVGGGGGGGMSGRAKYEESRLLLQQMSGQVQSGPAILAFLQGTDHLFIKKSKEFPPELSEFKPSLKREIWNSSCRTIYYAGQISQKFIGTGSSFAYQVVDYAGRKVITAVGSQCGPGTKCKAVITLGDANGIEIGTLSQDCCDAAYIVTATDSRVVFKIQGPCFAPCTPCVFWCCEEQFEIDMPDSVTEVGLISTHWKETHPEARGIYGISFPMKLETQQKALLLGCAFVIHFQYFRRGGNGTCFCFFYLLAILGILALLGKFYYEWY